MIERMPDQSELADMFEEASEDVISAACFDDA